MLLSVFGTPSAFTYAGCAIVRAIADTAAGSHAFIQAVFLDDVRNAWASLDRSRTKAVVLFSDFPATPLIELVRSARSPTVVFLDDFEEVAHQAIETRDMPVAHALRFASQVFCALDQLSQERVLLVTSKACGRPVGDLVSAASEFFGLAESAALGERVLARLGYEASRGVTLGEHFAGTRPRVVSDQAAAVRDDPHDQSLIKQVGSQYVGVGTGQGRADICWPTELFLEWDRPGAFLNGPIDLLGPARFIICGPYLHLPAGDWVANVVIEISENLSGNRLGVDVFSGTILRGVTMNLPETGVFEFSIPFQVEDPFLPVELRFQILTGAIEGKLMLQRVTFQRSMSRTD